MRRRFTIVMLGLVSASVFTPGAVRADAIDGEWCLPSGRHLSIDGERIVTPGGKRMTGEYDRHGFVYTVPAGESGAGIVISMSQLDEGHVDVRPDGGADSTARIWKRCAAPTS